MTAFEKLRLEHPDMVYLNAPGGCEDCPDDFGYLPVYENCIQDGDGNRVADDKRCTQCWKREIPEPYPSLVDEDDRELPVESPRILDSGNRRQFESGAVRDIQEGKGRCDLLPLDIVGQALGDGVFDRIYSFQSTGDVSNLYTVLEMFASHWDDGRKKGSTYDIIIQRNATMLLEVAKHFEEGCKKYGENNWQKGIPVHCYVDSGVRHYLKFLRGDTDEPHDRAFAWNLICAIWTCKHKPELNEYAKTNISESCDRASMAFKNLSDALTKAQKEEGTFPGVNYDLSCAFTHGD